MMKPFPVPSYSAQLAGEAATFIHFSLFAVSFLKSDRTSTEGIGVKKWRSRRTTGKGKSFSSRSAARGSATGGSISTGSGRRRCRRTRRVASMIALECEVFLCSSPLITFISLILFSSYQVWSNDVDILW
jgi:hypothetical protein